MNFLRKYISKTISEINLYFIFFSSDLITYSYMILIHSVQYWLFIISFWCWWGFPKTHKLFIFLPPTSEFKPQWFHFFPKTTLNRSQMRAFLYPPKKKYWVSYTNFVVFGFGATVSKQEDRRKKERMGEKL